MSGQQVLPRQQRAQQAAPLWRWWLREFRGVPGQVRAMRRWIQGVLPEYDPVDDLVAIGSELANNAVTHTKSMLPDASFTVQVGWSAEYARVVVGDRGAASEPRLKLGSTATSGRGLEMVAALASAWGVVGGAHGRWVWADVPWVSGGDLLPPEPDSGTPTTQELAGLLGAYPGTRIWFGGRSNTWWAFPSATGGLIDAPSPAALRQILATRYPGSAPVDEDPSRFVAAPVAPAPGTPSPPD